MGRASDVIIGLEVGAREIRGAALDLGGRELGAARRPLHAERAGAGQVELDPVRTWQTAVRLVHDLAATVPDLGRRTQALGLTGARGGLCLIDDDGDPLPPMVSPLDRRGGGGAAAARLRGGPGTPDLVRDLLRARPEALDGAALAVDVKGWVHACLTGEPARTAADAALDPGDTGSGSERDELERLLPPIRPPDQTLGLQAAAAAVTGLAEETPVVLAPPGPIAAALAAGVAEGAFAGAVAILDDDAWLVRPDRPGATVGDLVRLGGDLGASKLAPSEIGGAALDWLLALAEDLLAGGGLIGLTRSELESLLDERAGAAEPGRLCFRAGRADGEGSWTLSGLGETATIGDLGRAIYEGIGFAARAVLEAAGAPRGETRLAGSLLARAPARQVVPACLGVTTRQLHRQAPAATGAALHAAWAIREVPDLGAGAAAWITPYLAPPAFPEPALAERYRLAFDRWSAARSSPPAP